MPRNVVSFPLYLARHPMDSGRGVGILSGSKPEVLQTLAWGYLCIPRSSQLGVECSVPRCLAP